jgi:hypothetical protein
MSIIAVALLSLNMSEANPKKWQGPKGLVFGAISSIQNNNQGEPAWVLSGHWLTNIVNKTKDSFNQSNTAKFDSRIYMVILNRSSMHKHAISNFH